MNSLLSNIKGRGGAYVLTAANHQGVTWMLCFNLWVILMKKKKKKRKEGGGEDCCLTLQQVSGVLVSVSHLPGCSVVSEVVEHGGEPVVNLIQSALLVQSLQDGLKTVRHSDTQTHTHHHFSHHCSLHDIQLT